MRRPLKPGVLGHASFVRYDGVPVGRLRLDRWWDPTLDLDFGRPSDDRYRPLVVIGTNPSDADGDEDDNTSAKCQTYARREGANGLVMVNLDCRISTDPDEVCNVLLPYGAEEQHWEAVDGALCEDAVAWVAAWGKPPRGMSSYFDRVARVKEIAADVGRPLLCFGTNLDGSPKHPSRLPNATPLVPWWSPR